MKTLINFIFHFCEFRYAEGVAKEIHGVVLSEIEASVAAFELEEQLLSEDTS